MSGNWSDPALWTGGAVPNNGTPTGALYAVMLDAAGPAHTITLNTSVGLSSLDLSSPSATLSHTAGFLTLGGDFDIGPGLYTMSGGTLLGGTVNTSAPNRMRITSGTLDGVQVNGGFTVDGALTMTGGSGFSGALEVNAGSISYAGGGTIAAGTFSFLGNNTATLRSTGPGATLTLGPAVTVRGVRARLGDRLSGNPSVDTIVNQGLISADVLSPGNSIAIIPDTFTNQGRLEARNGGLLEIGFQRGTGNFSPPTIWTNTGVIEAVQGEIRLGGRMTPAGLGIIRRAPGASVLLWGEIDTSQQPLAITPDCNISFISTIIQGGQITVASGLSPNIGGRLESGVQITGDMTAQGLVFTGGLSVSGTATVAGSMRADGTQSLVAGNYVVQPAGIIRVNPGTTLTVEPGVSVRGAGLVGYRDSGSTPGAMINNGLISASTPGNEMTIHAETLINLGTIEAVNGGSLTFQNNYGLSTWTNFGTLRAASGGQLRLNGVYSFVNGSMVNDGGTIIIKGTLNNHDSTLSISGPGDVTLDGVIAGGTITTPGPGRLVVAGGGGGFGTLDDVTLAGDIEASSRTLRIRTALNLGGTIRTVGTNPTVFFESPSTLVSGTGSIVFAGASLTAPHRLDMAAGAVVTLGPGTVVRGGNGVLGDVAGIGSPSTLINQGRISADAPGQTLAIAATSFTNAGTVEALPGATLELGGELPTDPVGGVPRSWSSTGPIHAAGGTVRLGGTFDTPTTVQQSAGGSVVLTGVMNNANRTFTLDGASNSWTLGGAFEQFGAYRGARIVGGTVNLLNGATLNGGAALQDLTFNGSITATDTRTIFVHNSVMNGVAHIDPGGTIVLGPPGAPQPPQVLTQNVVFTGGGTTSLQGRLAADDLTIAAGTLVRGGKGTIERRGNQTQGALVNNGTISADVPGEWITISSNFVNNGVAESLNGATLGLSEQWRNNGVLRATGSTLSLAGFYSAAGLGNLQLTGATVLLGGTFNNTDNIFEVPPGNTLVANGTVKGGTLRLAPGSALQVSNTVATLDAVRVEGDIRLAGDSGILQIRNGFDHQGVTRLEAPASKVHFMGNNAFENGTMWFDPGPEGDDREIRGGSLASLQIGASAWIHGGRGLISTSNQATIVNHGRVSADAPGKKITIYTSRFQNHGTLEAINGGILDFQPPLPPGLQPDPVVLINGGVLRPPTGTTLLIAGDYEQWPSGSLHLTLGGPAAGGDYARLEVRDRAALAGVLSLTLAPGYTPAPGEWWSVLRLGTAEITGWFDTIDLGMLPAGYTWDTSQIAVTGEIGVIPAPGTLVLVLVGGGVAAFARRRPRAMEARP
ncbi:MAG: hypothetical protein WD749_14840 [Phycisphaerales bacterium]